MYRNFIQAAKNLSLLLILSMLTTWLLQAGLPPVRADPATSQIVINEIDYDQPGTDTGEFIEIYNGSGADIDLDPYSLRLVNGANTISYLTIALPAVSLPSGGYYVVCGDSAIVPFCNLDATPDSNLIQNGAPDAVALINGADLVDTLSYEGNTGAPYTETSGVGLVDDEGTASSGLSRCPNGVDNDQNNSDFSPRAITPGQANQCDMPIGACGDASLPVHTLQGSGASSAYQGTVVEVEGVVVGDFQDPASGLGGFFLQEEDSQVDADPLTSEGVFIYDNNFGLAVSPGDTVRVHGSASEYSGMTEISSIADMQVCGSGIASPALVSLPLASPDVWERYEGMLLTINQALYATGNYNQGIFGEVDLSVNGRLDSPTHIALPGATALAVQTLNDRSRIQLDDGSRVARPQPLPPYLAPDLTLRLGDSIPSLEGVLGYSFGAYEIHPTQALTFTRLNSRQSAPPSQLGTLKVATMNLLNFFTTLGGSAICGPSGTIPCRGATDAAEFTRQRDKLLSALLTIDADIVGLVELENNPTAAIQDLVGGLNAALGAGTYAYIDTSYIGTDAIKVGLIYKPARVTPVGAYSILDSTDNPIFLDTRNRPSLAQTFSDANDEVLTVVVNHFKSKGSACVGDPDTGDGQGNCNQTRTDAASALVSWLAADPTLSGDPDFLIIGDLNSYAREDPITAITTGGYANLVDLFLGDNAYSYVFDGASGYLDHALASASLAPQVTGLAEWHINADEPAALDYQDFNQAPLYHLDPYRASDHDPLVVWLIPGATDYLRLPLVLQNP